MPLLESTLASALEALVPTTDAAAAVQTLADAYRVYMAAATSNGLPLLGTGVAASEMAQAMTFPADGTAASAAGVLADGVQTFWSQVARVPSSSFAGATLITPPTGLAGLAVALTTVFETSVGSSLEESAAALAAALHTASAGGTATFPGPVVTAIT